MIKALATCLTVIALAGCTVPIERTASGEIPPSRIYIKSMTQQQAGLNQIAFNRAGGLLNNQMMELAINDVVLAQITGGEHLSIWLQPGSYVFSVKPAASLNGPDRPDHDKVTVEVKQGGNYQVNIASDLHGLKMVVTGQ